MRWNAAREKKPAGLCALINMGYKVDDGSLKQLADKVILATPKLQHLVDDCLIAFQWCTKDRVSGGRTVFGECSKVSDKVKAFVGFDYIITFYPAAMELNEIGLARLMKHELLHIKTDGEKFQINQHDVQDFREMLESYGFDWAQSQMFEDESQRPIENEEEDE